MKSNVTISPAAPQISIWRRVLTVTAVLVVVLIIIGGVTLYQSLQLKRLTARHASTLNIEALTARSMLHTYQLIDKLQSSYITHNPQYIRANAEPFIQALQEDGEQLAQLVDEIESPALKEAVETALPDIKKVTTLAKGLISQAETDNWPSANIRLRTLRQQESVLLVALDNILSTAANYHKSQTFSLHKTNQIIIFVPLIVTLLGILLLLGGAVAVRQMVVQPINELNSQVQRFAEGDFSLRLPIQRNDEIGHLAHTFNLMADRIQEAYASMSQRVEERTQALQRRTAQLQAATEIGRAVSTLREMNELLGRAALLISQRYGFYHVGIFIANEAGDEAVLRAAYTQNSDAGQKLLAQHYTVSAHSENIVGLTLASAHMHTEQYHSGEHSLPGLSATRGEIAIPLKHGEEILGVLDIHSKTTDTFTPEDITALQAVADLLAIAITNTRLFQETQNALEAARRAYDQISQAGWQRFLHMRKHVGFRLDESGQVYPIAAAETASSETAETEAAPTATESDEHEIQFPVKARGRTIAITRLRKATPWTDTEKRLMQRLSERLGSALESARLYAEAQRRAAQLQIASEIARDASGTLDLDELLKKAINLVRERFNFYHASVFLLDDSGQYAYVKESTGEAGRQLKARQHRLAVGSNSTVGQTLALGKPVVINDVTESDVHHFNPLLPETRAELAIPLKVGDEIIGALDVQSTAAHAFGEEDVRILHILADQLAIAVINARLFAETQKHLQQHRRLHQITAAAAAATTVEEAMRNVVESIHAIRPNENVLLLISDEEQPDTLRVAAWAGHYPESAQKIAQIRLPFGKGITGRAAETRDGMIISDTSAAEDYIAITPNMRSELAVPLIYRGELIGVLDLESPLPNAYDEHDLEMNRTLANSLAAIIANIRLLEQVRRHSGKLELLYEITSAASSHVELDKLLADLTSRLQRELDLLHCGVIIFDENGETGTLVASASAHGAPGQDMLGIKLPLNTPTIQKAIRTHRPVLCRDVANGEMVADIREILLQRGTRQIIVVPLLARDEVIGTLGLDIADTKREITDEELRLLEQIAHQIATSVEVARLFQKAMRTAERERLVTEITTKMRATNDPQAILQTAVEELRRALRAQQTQIVFVDETTLSDEG